MRIQPSVDAAIRQLCPIHGVSFGKLNDKSTWRINFQSQATPAERAAAQAFVDGFDLVGALAAEDNARARDAAVDGTIAGDTTLAQLKAMDNAAFDAWWAANVTNAAQAIAVLKRLARVVIRRLL